MKRTISSPYSGEAIGDITLSTKEDVIRAIDVAVAANHTMAQLPAHKRSQILYKVSHLLQEQAEEAAMIIAKETAKPITYARGEVARTIETYTFAAEEAKRIYGETIPLDASASGENRLAYTIHEPLGTIAAITPFNFPMNLVAHKIGPAIASGNTILVKPASQTPFSALFIASLFEKAGLPKGALQIVLGSGKEIGDILLADKRIKMITFTGSPEVGKYIRSKAGLKRVTLELGSNSALIVDKNVNINEIIPRCVFGAFSFQGQVCISLQRIYVHEAIYDLFVEQFVQETKQLICGDPLQEETQISAVISTDDTARIIYWIEEAKEKGAAIATGGTVHDHIISPTVLLHVPPQASVSCEEVFGPIVMINKIKSIHEAIEYVNDSRFGLQAGIYTNHVPTALHATRALHVGGVMINDIPTFRVDQMPYGGVKDSGTGREGIKYAIQEMTELKLVVWK